MKKIVQFICFCLKQLLKKTSVKTQLLIPSKLGAAVAATVEDVVA